MKKNFAVNKNDILLIFIVIIISLSFIAYKKYNSSNGYAVQVYVDNELYGEYSLYNEQIIEVIRNDSVCNIVCIRDGHAYMQEATCPDKLCINQQSISLGGESICCLPNNVLVSVKSDGIGEYDAISK